MPMVVGFLRKPTGRVLKKLLEHRFPGAPDIGLPEGEDGNGGNGEEEDGLDFWGGERPSRPDLPTLPPREEWPELPPWVTEPRPGNPLPLPIPPRPGAPTVPLPPDPEIDELPEIWPPLPSFPGVPDLSGKTLALVTIHVSRRVHFVRWMIIDHEEAKGKLQKVMEFIKSKLPAGGIGGRPPQRPGGGPETPGQHR